MLYEDTVLFASRGFPALFIYKAKWVPCRSGEIVFRRESVICSALRRAMSTITSNPIAFFATMKCALFFRAFRRFRLRVSLSARDLGVVRMFAAGRVFLELGDLPRSHRN